MFHVLLNCVFTCIFYAVVRQISMLFTDNKDSVFLPNSQCGLCGRKTTLKKKLSALPSLLASSSLRLIIIMYVYHALINALSAHMIHINLNMIFYTHVEHMYCFKKTSWSYLRILSKRSFFSCVRAAKESSCRSIWACSLLVSWHRRLLVCRRSSTRQLKSTLSLRTRQMWG